MIAVLAKILQQLELLTITGKDAERMTAIKSMVRDLIELIRAEQARRKETPNDP